MSKTLEKVQNRAHVMYVDDERADGNPIMLVLRDGFDFADDPGCGSKGVDTVAEAERITRASNVIPSRK